MRAGPNPPVEDRPISRYHIEPPFGASELSNSTRAGCLRIASSTVAITRSAETSEHHAKLGKMVADGPEPVLLAAEFRAVLEKALGELPERQRAVVELRDERVSRARRCASCST